MSEFKVPVVRVGLVSKHTNADALSTVQVEGETVIIRTGDFQEGDLAIYIPVDAVVPTTVPGTEFLGDHRRIKAKRLRGVYSEGLLLPTNVLGQVTHIEVGADTAGLLGITKHEDKVPDTWGTSVHGPSVPNRKGFWGRFLHWCFREQLHTTERDPGCIPVYDIENGKKYHSLLSEGSERVIVSEKIHGTNARYGVVNGKFYMGSRNMFWRDLVNREVPWREHLGNFVHTKLLGRKERGQLKQNLYCQVAKQYDLEQKLSMMPNLVFYGEIYGRVQDLIYGAEPGQVWFRV